MHRGVIDCETFRGAVRHIFVLSDVHWHCVSCIVGCSLPCSVAECRVCYCVSIAVGCSVSSTVVECPVYYFVSFAVGCSAPCIVAECRVCYYVSFTVGAMMCCAGRSDYVSSAEMTTALLHQVKSADRCLHG